MALTATAVKSLQREVCVILGMHISVAVSSCRTNIMSAVYTFSTVKETFRTLLLHFKDLL